MIDNPWGELENRPQLTHVRVAEVTFRPGDHVRLRPYRRADIFDMFLHAKTAIIESLEEDYDHQVHVAVVVDDDPGRDIGLERHIGHRFFFAIDEIEAMVSSHPDGESS